MVKDPEFQAGCAVSIENLDFSWNKQHRLLNIPSIQINRGERVFFKGASGSGKSTLLGLIGGILVPKAGSISVLGQSINTLSNAQRDRFRVDHIGIIFQMFNLIPYISVLENVLLPCRFSKKRRLFIESNNRTLRGEAERLLQQLDLPTSLWSRSANELSVGQQQRVAVARALIGSPEIVIADEPTSALDADRRNSFMDLLLQECEKENRTLIFVSHDPALQSFFKRQIDLMSFNVSDNGN